MVDKLVSIANNFRRKSENYLDKARYYADMGQGAEANEYFLRGKSFLEAYQVVMRFMDAEG